MFNKINKKDVLIKQEFDRINNRITCISKDNKAQHKNIFTTLRKEIDEKINKLPALPELVECDVCGCLLNKKTAIKGESRIVQEYHCNTVLNRYLYGAVGNTEEKIEEVYYCKCHAPKTKKSKK